MGLSKANLWSRLIAGAGGGGGTVNSVGITSNAQDITVGGVNPVTTVGTITLNKTAEFDNGSKTSSVTIDWANGAKQRVTLTSGRPVTFPATVQYSHGIGTAWSTSTFANAPCVVTFANPVDSSRYALRFIQGDTTLVDEVILDYANGTYTVFSFTTFDPNARNSAYSASFPNNAANYVTVPYNSSFTFLSGGMTISAWVRPTSVATQASVVENYLATGNSPGWAFRMGLDVASKMSLFVETTAGANFSADDSLALVAATWTHIAVTYDGVTTVKFYQNGVNTVTRAVTQRSVDASNAALHIGVSSNSPVDRPWNGFIRDVALYNVALSAGNLALLYNSGRPPDLKNASSVSGILANLVAWWPLGDGDSSASWADGSGNGNTGTTVGAVSIVNSYPNP